MLNHRYQSLNKQFLYGYTEYWKEHTLEGVTTVTIIQKNSVALQMNATTSVYLINLLTEYKTIPCCSA